MAQYLMNLLSQHEISQGFHGGNFESGRMGDYVFNQEGISYWDSFFSMTQFSCQRWIK